MKKLILIIVMLIILPSWADTWVKSYIDDVGNVWYLEADSIKVTPTSTNFWVKQLYKTPMPFQNKLVSYSIVNMDAHCDKKTVSVGKLFYFDNQGSVIAKNLQTIEKTANKGGMAEAFYNNACMVKEVMHRSKIPMHTANPTYSPVPTD